MFRSDVNLSDRQSQVLYWLAQGLTSQEIGEKLYLSAATVKNYRFQLLEALGARNAAEAVHRAHELGILR